jgi:hypothetical protein
MRFARAAAALALLVPLAGCLADDERLTLERDGSGHMTVDLEIDASFLAEIRKLVPGSDGPQESPLEGLVTEERIRKDCDAKGITVKSCAVDEAGPSRKRVRLAIDFADLDALRATRLMSDREIELVEAGDDLVELVYRYDARPFLRSLDTGQKKEPRDETEKKIHEILESARKASSAKFVLKLPGKLESTNGEKVGEGSARFKADAAALEKEPLEMRVKLAKKDVPFWEAEVARAKARQKDAPAPLPSEKPEEKNPH